MATVSFHYSGDLIVDHKITILALSKTLTCLQNAINRAYLDNKYGGIWKHARISSNDYEAISFWVGSAKEGGYILDAIASTMTGKKILDRIASALQPVYTLLEKGIEEEVSSLEGQAESINKLLPTLQIHDYAQFVEIVKKTHIRRYGDRSILKEFDEMFSLLRSENAGKSILELTMEATDSNTYRFNAAKSSLFHSLVSKKTLAEPVKLTGRIEKLDRIHLNGRFVNSYNNKKCTIRFENDADFQAIHPFLVKDKVDIIASPILEFGTFDVSAGDLYFIALQDNA